MWGMGLALYKEGYVAAKLNLPSCDKEFQYFYSGEIQIKPFQF